MKRAAALAAILACAWACDRGAPPPLPPGATLAEPVARVAADLGAREDEPVDPAIWVHPQYASQSLVLGASPRTGLAWHGLDGRRLGTVTETSPLSTCDVAYGLGLADREVDAVAATTPNELVVWTVDPDARTLSVLGRAPLQHGDGAAPSALAMHQRVRDGAHFAFIGDAAGRIAQLRLDGSSGALAVEAVREFEIGGGVSGLVADDERATLFVAEAGRGVWRYDAEPDAPSTARDRAQVIALGAPELGAEIGGIALYAARAGRGFLLVSLRDVDRVLVLDREPPHAIRKVVDPRAGADLADVARPDGIAVESVGLGAPFESGIVVLRGGGRSADSGALRLYAWRDVAGIDLLVDVERDPRRPHRVR